MAIEGPQQLEEPRVNPPVSKETTKRIRPWWLLPYVLGMTYFALDHSMVKWYFIGRWPQLLTGSCCWSLITLAFFPLLTAWSAFKVYRGKTTSVVVGMLLLATAVGVWAVARHMPGEWYIWLVKGCHRRAVETIDVEQAHAWLLEQEDMSEEGRHLKRNEHPDFIREFAQNHPWVHLGLNEQGDRILEVFWGGGFINTWGLVISTAEEATPEEGRDHHWQPVTPYAYVWAYRDGH